MDQSSNNICIGQRRVQSDGLKCSESREKEDAVTCVIFHCNLPGSRNEALEFNCREPSCGALEGTEKAVELTDDDYTVDPNFFDEGYALAGATGFKVWTGSRLMIETLAWPQSGDSDRLQEIQRRIYSGARLIELGSGVGVVGTYLSAIGSQVLLTDLSTLVENALWPNLLRNEKILSPTSISSTGENSCPSWLAPDGIRLGKGFTSCTPLDWTVPLHEQLTKGQSSSVDFIIASDVVFLVSMLNSLLNTVEDIFNASTSNNTSFILSFQRRDAKEGEESSAFTTVEGVISAVKEREWSLSCLAWRPVTVKKEIDRKVTDELSEVFVFEISP